MSPAMSTTSSKKRRYLSYLLRLWQIESEGQLVWRASLESPKTGQRQGFAGLAEMVAFLEGQMDMPDDYRVKRVYVNSFIFLGGFLILTSN